VPGSGGGEPVDHGHEVARHFGHVGVGERHARPAAHAPADDPGGFVEQDHGFAGRPGRDRVVPRLGHVVEQAGGRVRGDHGVEQALADAVVFAVEGVHGAVAEQRALHRPGDGGVAVDVVFVVEEAGRVRAAEADRPLAQHPRVRHTGRGTGPLRR
jgi:hypothetical protein